MIKVSVLYPNKPGSHFDMNYYVGKHMPLAMRLLNKGLRKTEVDAGVQGTAPASRPRSTAAANSILTVSRPSPTYGVPPPRRSRPTSRATRTWRP